MRFDPHRDGLITAPQDQASREARARYRPLKAFTQHFFAHRCTEAFSAMHEEYFAWYDAHRSLRGWRRATAAPRGSAKTTTMLVITSMYELAYGLEEFITIVSSRNEMAVAKVREIRDEIDSNRAYQRLYGVLPGSKWNEDELITASGARVIAVGRRTQIRGALFHGRRPTKILLDDAESSEEVLSTTQREKFEVWVGSDIMKLGDKRTNVQVVGTILAPDSYLETLLTNPVYEAFHYQSVRHFSPAIDLWSHWRDLVIDLSDPHRLQTARAYFETNQAAMLAGTDVLWPEQKDYYALMLARITDGESAFWTEEQNEPRGSARLLFPPESLTFCQPTPTGIVRAGGTHLPWLAMTQRVAFWDPTPGSESQRSDWAACPIGYRDVHGYAYCVDAYMGHMQKPSDQIAGIVDLLWRWQVPVLGVETNAFASLLIDDLREAIAQHALRHGVAWEVRLVPVVHSKAKTLRIPALEPYILNGWLQFAEGLDPQALHQLTTYMLTGTLHDDFPDALAGMMALLVTA